ncbi:hypothetical protein [Noviherbaspirillum pedocola]|uniref:Uncharacterized protein n=1 Tax=Noviherbaspirillum pedocola TaxID=2801341 RepID=A0A934WA62_9BURK|nr:hypothetical protein [Noviherbaspirillum pedocola]MBK4739258.1 hypothetical protein [Noviherbaspirillum pedocola]
MSVDALASINAVPFYRSPCPSDLILGSGQATVHAGQGDIGDGAIERFIIENNG